ncbi:MAG: menaquinone biosynthesis family protein [bacterium]
MSTNDRVLLVGHSPDPDDAFMFFGLAKGHVRIRDYAIEHCLEEIESLNRRAQRGELAVTAISAHAYPAVADRYWILPTGSSVGRGYGPIVVARSAATRESLAGKRVALPGAMTTAALLARFYLPGAKFEHVPFDAVIPAVNDGAVDAGVLIHEGQITYADHGLVKIADFGELWAQEEGGLPIPLGLDVVRKDLGAPLAREINTALRESIRYAMAHKDAAIAYALEFGRGIPAKIGERFVGMYVNDDTLDLPADGRRALDRLYARGIAAGALPAGARAEFVPDAEA